MATPMRGTTATTADDVERIRVLTIAITAPQHGTKHRWPLLARRLEAAGIELEQEMQQGDQALAVGVQEAEIASAAKALGQHVLENQPEEIDPGERAPFRLAGLSVAIAEAHLAILAGEDVLLRG
jgi:hypothetical protein